MWHTFCHLLFRPALTSIQTKESLHCYAIFVLTTTANNKNNNNNKKNTHSFIFFINLLHGYSRIHLKTANKKKSLPLNVCCLSARVFFKLGVQIERELGLWSNKFHIRNKWQLLKKIHFTHVLN